MLFLLASVSAFLFFESENNIKIKESKRFLGYYKLDRFNCNECNDCKLLLEDNFQYYIIKDHEKAGSGKWDLAFDREEAGYYLSFDNNSKEIIDETKREVQSLDKSDCCIINCNENVRESFEGIVVDIGNDANYFGQKAVFISERGGDTIKYYPKYYSHPWFQDQLNIGDFFSKEKQSMNFKIVHKNIVHRNEDTIFLSYKIPICEDICDLSKIMRTTNDSAKTEGK